MYKFADTKAGSGIGSPMPLQTIFNGINVDSELTDEFGSFRTLTVSGRGVLEKQMIEIETPYRHGKREGSYRYQPREISVKFLLSANSTSFFRERFDQLSFLFADTKKRLAFTDDEGYFLATLKSCNVPEEDSNHVVGTLDFICNDPAKYKEQNPIVVTQARDVYHVGGHATTNWVSRTIFKKPVQFYSFERFNTGKILINHSFGENDLLEIDYKRRLIQLNGVDRMPLLAIASEWFPLQAGVNELQATEETVVTYQETYY